MRRSKTLARLRTGKTARATCLGHFLPAFLHASARLQYDCIWLDLEHRDMSMTHVQALLAYSHLFDIDVLVRPPTSDKVALYRYLEEGAAGLLIPHVSTPEQAEALVMATKFPPLGERGIDNAGLDADYNTHPVDEYVDWANRETFLAVQIETPGAVDRVDEIAAVDGVDLIFVGPGDLDVRLRQNGRMTLDAAIDRVAEVCAAQNKPWGCPALKTETFQQLHSQGARFLVASGDFFGLMQGLEQGARQFDHLA